MFFWEADRVVRSPGWSLKAALLLSPVRSSLGNSGQSVAMRDERKSDGGRTLPPWALGLAEPTDEAEPSERLTRSRTG